MPNESTQFPNSILHNPMNKTPLILMVAACGSLVNCRSTVAMSSGELASVMKDSPLGAKRVSVSVQVKSPGEKAVDYPAKTVRLGEDFSIRSTREFIYPAAYEPAAVVGDAVTPPDPADLTKIQTGLTLSLKAEGKGQLVILSGKATYVNFDRFVKMGGEVGRPIVSDRGDLLTENSIEMPAIRTYETPVFYGVKAGGSGSFEIDHPKKGTRMTVTVGAVK